MKTHVAVIRTLATNRSTYRFLGLLAVALGVVHGGLLAEGLGDIVCALLGE